MTQQTFNSDTITECRRRLVSMRAELLNRSRTNHQEFFAANNTSSGDEVDLAVAHLAENTFLVTQDRIRKQLLEIDSALARIENGVYGICEETQEPIEAERLLAIPYTRLSIEGAEIREAFARKYAR